MNTLFIPSLYVTLLCIFLHQLLQVNAIKPTPRWANSCVILSGSLVCFGGEQAGKTLSNDVYSLDLYHAWETTLPPWEQTQMETTIAPRAYFGSAPCWTQGFIVNGGITNNPSTSIALPNATFLYNAQKKTWDVPSINGITNFSPRKQHTETADYQGRIWIWGGVSDSSTQQGASTVYYSLWMVLDTTTWSFSTPPVHNDSPPPRIDHTATLITNQEILIMGGVIFSKNVTDPAGSQTLLPVSMNQIVLYNTATGKWKNFTAGGNIPAPRRGHSSVLHQDNGNIIVFGGGTPDNDQVMLNDVFVLQLENLEWNSPSIIGVPPKPRKYHQANLMDTLMLVTFGIEKEGIGYNDINILDVNNWKWISTYTPNENWLSGNITSNNGVTKNSTGTYGNPYTGNQDPATYPRGSPYSWDDPNSSSGIISDGPSQTNQTDSKIKAGVIAGVISGGVVVLGGGIFLILSKALHRKRQAKRRRMDLKAKQEQHHDPHRHCEYELQQYHQYSLQKMEYKRDNMITLADLGEMCMTKPDNRSSYAHAYDDGEQHKPNEHEHYSISARAPQP